MTTNDIFSKMVNDKQRVFHFSGGRTSAYMVKKYYKPGDLVIFCDTGREYEGTYKFIDNFEVAENIPIIRLKYSGGWRELLRKRKAIPNHFKRFCTIEMKAKTARRYLVSLGIRSYIQFIGFRADEKRRVLNYTEKWKKVQTFFPLNEDGINKNMVLDYWKSREYNLDIPSILGNCTLCFQKGENAIISILREYPELAKEWIEDEEMYGHTYLKGISMSQMLDASKRLKKQYDLFDIQPKFNCSCTS